MTVPTLATTSQTRYYYLQNWRADVVALIQTDGVPLEYVRYSAYGVPFVYSAADVNRDGVLDILDTYAWDDFTGSTTGDIAVSPDVNRDGATNSADATFISDWDGTGLWSSSGRGFVSRLDSRKGYAGYEFDPATTQWHVRHRVLVSEMGRWGRRDPLGYYDEQSLVSYANHSPLINSDPLGLWSENCSPSLPCSIVGNASEGASPATLWQPADMCAFPGSWSNCNKCAEKAELWAQQRGLRPGDRCYELTLRKYMMYCVSYQDPHQPAFDALSECRQSGQVNGCGGRGGVSVPDRWFGACCNSHDTCYGTCGRLKANCDWQFYQCMLAACDGIPDPIERGRCKLQALVYYSFVDQFGTPFYDAGQYWACKGGRGAE